MQNLNIRTEGSAKTLKQVCTEGLKINCVINRFRIKHNVVSRCFSNFDNLLCQ